MNNVERRLRALEAMAKLKPRQAVPRIVVGVGETMAEVVAREGVVPVEGQLVGLIVRQLVAPAPRVVGNGVDASE